MVTVGRDLRAPAPCVESNLRSRGLVVASPGGQRRTVGEQDEEPPRPGVPQTAGREEHVHEGTSGRGGGEEELTGTTEQPDQSTHITTSMLGARQPITLPVVPLLHLIRFYKNLYRCYRVSCL